MISNLSQRVDKQKYDEAFERIFRKQSSGKEISWTMYTEEHLDKIIEIVRET